MTETGARGSPAIHMNLKRMQVRSWNDGGAVVPKATATTVTKRRAFNIFGDFSSFPSHF